MTPFIRLTILSGLLAFAISVSAQTIQWEKSYGGAFAETGFRVINTPDGGYLVGSHAESNNGDVNGNHGSSDLWLLKLNASGVKQWQKCYGGANYDGLTWLGSSSFGGYLLIGNALSNGEKSSSQVYGNHGGQDVWVIKVDDNGNIEWRRCYGGCELDEIRQFKQTSDGNYVLCGGTFTNNSGDVYGSHGERDGWVLKIAPNGDLLWQKSIGGSQVDYFYDIEETSDGKLILAGLSASLDGDLSGSTNHGQEDFWVVQLSATGTLEWSKTYGGSFSDGSRTMCLAADGSIIVSGLSRSIDGDVSGNHGADDAWTIHLSPTGQLLWQRSFGGSAVDYGFHVFQRSENDFILVGETQSDDGDVSGYHGGRDVWMVKFDKDGNLKSQMCLGGSNADFARNATQGNGLDIIIAATSSSDDGDVSQNFGASDLWLINLSVPLGLKPDLPDAISFGLTVDPNPAKTFVRISTDAPGQKQVSVYNEIGQVIHKTDMHESEVSVNIDSWPAGSYVVKIATKDGQNISRIFVKE